MILTPGELLYLESIGGCDDEEEGEECSAGMNQRGDLLLCDLHAANYSPNSGRVPGEVRCFCGGYKTAGEECDEPCSTG
jgi:hypothetical protein